MAVTAAKGITMANIKTIKNAARASATARKAAIQATRTCTTRSVRTMKTVANQAAQGVRVVITKEALNKSSVRGDPSTSLGTKGLVEPTTDNQYVSLTKLRQAQGERTYSALP